MATKPTPDTADNPADEGARQYVPEGYKDADEFLTEARDLYRIDREADSHNIDAAEDDLKFASAGIDGNGQWDSAALQARNTLGQPSITNNSLPQFIGQVVGDRRINQVSIKVLPREDSDVDIAEIRSDLIRNIEVQSRAERVYSQAFEHMVTCGIGNFRVELDWTDDDVFDRDIFIRPIPNPLSVTWDHMSVDPTGRDAEHCFVEDVMPRKLFDKLYPDTPVTDMGDTGGWIGNDDVRVTEFWRMVQRDRVIALMADGSVIDVTDKNWDEYAGSLFRDEMGQPRIRNVRCKYANMHLINGFSILKPKYELKINRLPIIRCNGREFPVEGKRVRFGLVRFVKDNQRLANFWDSVKAEILSKAPRQQWIGPSDAFEGWENEFRTGHINGDPILRYNKNASAQPVPVPPVQYPAAFAQESALNKQQMRDGTGIHEANLGMRSNETSGKAILARQQEGDVATVIYHDNMNASEQEAGDIINQLIPQVYDTARTIRVIGQDQEARLQRINDPMHKDSVDLAKGKYDVTISTGAAFQTRRQESQQSMTELMRSGLPPEYLAVLANYLPKSMDWPGADKIAEDFRKISIKAGIIEDDNDEMNGEGGQPSPEQQAQAQQQAMMQQQAEMAQQAQMITLQAQVAEAQAKARQAEAMAAKAEADAQKAQIEAQQAEVNMHAGIGEHLDKFSGVGQPEPTNKPQPGNATRTRNPGRQRR